MQDYSFILESYRAAISHFQNKYHHFPSDLEALVSNKEGIRFIRRLYADPFTGGPLNSRRNMEGGITDVYSPAVAQLSREY